jgi:hypothetical protein
MGEAKRRREENPGAPILMEMAREIDAALEAEDEVAAAEKLVDAIALFGCDPTLAALGFSPKYHIMESESSGPFWRTMIKCFIAKEPGQRLDESIDAYNARVATALSDTVNQLQHHLFSSLQAPPGARKQDYFCVVPDNIKVGDRFIERFGLRFTPEGAELVAKGMVEEHKAERAAAKQPSPIKSGSPWGRFR